MTDSAAVKIYIKWRQRFGTKPAMNEMQREIPDLCFRRVPIHLCFNVFSCLLQVMGPQVFPRFNNDYAAEHKQGQKVG